ncbi:cGMP-dependent protein kinase [Thraustotheca clavata]|uniref:cGMP-dependent protein kinase n=1 Tax=Thraustotheca clavata TaxID=74557 RepID=A0A1V9ZCQ8_9STRA|nr:cGMP-dependent protein kinase [Thraustotheca clavata]
MCGIAGIVCPSNANVDELQQAISHCLQRRGPDYFNTVNLVEDAQLISLSSGVLHLRGDAMAKQPIVDEVGNVLLWNGEVFGGITIRLSSSDTNYVAQMLMEATKIDKYPEEVGNHVMEAMLAVEGPYAFVWYHSNTKTLVYGRDPLGRRSLLVSLPKNTNEPFVIASASVGSGTFTELPCTGVFYVQITSLLPIHVPWNNTRKLSPLILPSDTRLENLPFTSDIVSSSPSMLTAAKELLRVLSHAVGVRIQSIPIINYPEPRVGVLFSGGLDSVVLGALAHFYLPEDEPLELYNICFDAYQQSPDRKAALASWRELRELFPQRDFRFVEMNVPYLEVTKAQPTVVSLIQPCDTHMDFNIGSAFWFLSRGIGVLGDTSNTIHIGEKVSITPLLFKTLPEEGRCPATKCQRKQVSNCPLQLCRTCCTRVLKFASKLSPAQTFHPQEVEAAKKSLEALGITDIELLISLVQTTHSHDTPAKISTPVAQQRQEYLSKVKVLLVGIGADEQLAGYTRHKTAFEHNGYEGLKSELQMDMNRIWQRNLGRDDRMIADHGREARFPYLDEHVVDYLKAIPLDNVVDFQHPRGIGDKMILRVLARQLGLKHCTGLPKQAIQFGTRIAKQSNASSVLIDKIMGAGASVLDDKSLQSFRLLKREYTNLMEQRVSDEVMFDHMKKMYVSTIQPPRPTEETQSKRGTWTRRVSHASDRSIGKKKRINIFEPGHDTKSVRSDVKHDEPRLSKKSPETTKLLKESIQALLFEATTDGEMDMVVAAMTSVQVKAGEVIIRQHDHGDKFYVLEDGLCECIVNDVHVGEVCAGGHFGELALIYDAPRAATVIATTDCRLWALGRNEFRIIQAQSSMESLTKRSEWLQKVPLFAGLTSRQLTSLNRCLEVVTYEDGANIVQQGHKGDAFYIIASGTVGCYVDGSKRNLIMMSSSKSEIARLHQGDYFGETALLNDQPRNCTVRAIGLVKCVRLMRADFCSMIGPLAAILESNGIKRALRTHEHFANLTDEELEFITRQFEIVEYEDQDVIFQPDSPAEYFYIIRDGRVIVQDFETENVPLELNIKDSFGCEAITGGDYKSTATCLGSTTCFRLAQTAILDDIKVREEVMLTARTHAQHPLSTLQLDDFVHIGVLGEGSFGRVTMVQAFLNSEEYLLALKCVSKAHVIECQQQEHIVRERAILKELPPNPFVVQLYATFQDSNYLYMLLELVQGGELFSVLHTDICGRDLDEDDMKFYAACVYLGLEHMHKRDIAYRDLKPENLLISSTGFLKIVDMGFAKKIPFTVTNEDGTTEVNSRSYTLCGTQEYLAPEFVLNTGHDIAVDYWAFGVLIYEMLLGYTPFETSDGDIASLFKNIAFVRTGANAVQFPSDLLADSSQVCDLVERLLNGDPTKRLGMGVSGPQDIMGHPWFDTIDWARLRRQSIDAPYVPQLSSRYDTSLFDGDQGLRINDADYDGAQDSIFAGF